LHSALSLADGTALGKHVTDDVFEFLTAQLREPSTHWNMGTFGAIAEFMRVRDEPVELKSSGESASAVTSRGAISLRRDPEMRLVAYESTTRESWSHGVALCLSAQRSRMSGRKVLSELGADVEAPRREDRNGILFDLGLDVPQVDVCVRTSDPEVIAKLREGSGRPAFSHDSPAMGAILAASPHRVFMTKLGRVEVYQSIPAANGRSPDGPHTHVLPKLLQHKRTHAATEPIPEGLVPCGHFHPSHPVKDEFGQFRPFDFASHAAFQTMLNAFGNPHSNALKRQVRAEIAAAKEPSEIAPQTDRFARTTIRVALRQLAAESEKLPVISAWRAAYDRAAEAAEETGDPYEH
jgi:hypothetical protein